MNASRAGLSLSVGGRGAWLTSGTRGRRATVGLPGTGLFWTERLKPAAAAPNVTGRYIKRSRGRPTWVVLLVLAGLMVAAITMR